MICDNRGARARPISPSPCPSSVGGGGSQENQADKSVRGDGARGGGGKRIEGRDKRVVKKGGKG